MVTASSSSAQELPNSISGASMTVFSGVEAIFFLPSSPPSQKPENSRREGGGLITVSVRPVEEARFPSGIRKNSAVGITDQGAMTRGQRSSLAKTKSLKELDLTECGIEDKGAAKPGKALATNSTLKHVSFSKSMIGSEGGDAISEVMTKNTSARSFPFDNAARGMSNQSFPPFSLL